MWLSRDHDGPRILPIGQLRRVVVGVPARNEAADLGACLAALDRSAGRCGMPVTILVGVNNSSDGTGEIARRFVACSATVIVDDFILPLPIAHAGGARRHVLDRAAELAGPGGVVMTTDADSHVDGDWIAANLGEIAGGADAVAGMIAFDAAARAGLPDLAHRDVEWRLAALHARLEHLIDPRPHDPWPRHIWAWGASLALTVETYRGVGGVPQVPLAEDRALAEAVERCGFRLRHSHAPLVYTSSRRVGRAPGGFADMLAGFASDATSLCDAALEPTRPLHRRLAMRAKLRAEHGSGSFGDAWATLEAATPTLVRQRVRPGDLAGEIIYAERLIKRLQRRATHRGDSRAYALAA